MKKTLLIFLVLTLMISLSTCGDNGEKFKWSNIELSSMLPKPKSNRAKIYSNTKNELSIFIYKTSENQYKEYVETCEKQGFTIDSKENNFSYDAYNQEGYKVNLFYSSRDEYMEIKLTLMEMSEIIWPTSDSAKLLPVPKSNIGQINWEHSYGLVVYVGNTPISDYNEYVQACSEAGFNVDYSEGDGYYYADDKNGYHISLKYEGYNVCSY